MNGPVWVGWIVVIVMTMLSVVLLIGKGAFLIAGYNTSSREEKARYNEKKLCRVIGAGLSTMTVILAIFMSFNGDLPKGLVWLIPWGLLGTIAIMIILANIICKRKEG